VAEPFRTFGSDFLLMDLAATLAESMCGTVLPLSGP
jgi:hypothetical protein